MKSHYKVIFLDLDGILLQEDKTISKINIEILTEIEKLGVKVVVITGRSYEMTKELTKDLPFEYSIIANNGAIITSETREVIALHTLDKSIVTSVFTLSQRMGVHTHIHLYSKDTDKAILVDNIEKFNLSNNQALNIQQVGLIEDYEVGNLDNILALVYVDSPEKIKELEYESSILSLNCTMHTIEACLNGKVLLEFLHPLSNKGSAIEEFCRNVNIPIELSIAIGDENNDISMLQKSGLSIAMKNGNKRIKEIADIVTEFSNDNNGVGMELAKIFNL